MNVEQDPDHDDETDLQAILDKAICCVEMGQVASEIHHGLMHNAKRMIDQDRLQRLCAAVNTQVEVGGRLAKRRPGIGRCFDSLAAMAESAIQERTSKCCSGSLNAILHCIG